MFIFKNNRGMSYMEIMVSISIMVMVLSLSTVNYRSANKRMELVVWADKLVSDIRLMENYAASVRIFNNDSKSNIWGIYLDTSSSDAKYVLFNDDDSTHNVHNIFREVKLPSNITISSIEKVIGASSSYPSEIYISFIPPDPEVNLSGGDKIIITLQDNINGSIKEVLVNFVGLVEVHQ